MKNKKTVYALIGCLLIASGSSAFLLFQNKKNVSEVPAFHDHHTFRAIGQENSQTLSLTIEPVNATDQVVLWSTDWDGSQSGLTSDFLSLTPSIDTHSAVLYAKAPWNGDIVVTVSLNGFSDSCLVNWYEIANGITMNSYSTQGSSQGSQSFTGSYHAITVQPNAYMGFNFTPTTTNTGIVIDSKAMGYSIVSGNSVVAAEQIDPANLLFNFEAVSAGQTTIRFYVADDDNVTFDLAITVYQPVTGLTLDNNNLTF